MGCCGGGGREDGEGHGTGKHEAGGINWVQIVALGLIAVLIIGFVIGK